MPAWKNASWQPPVYLNLPHFAFIAPLAGSFIFRWGPQQINLNLWSSGRQGRKPWCWIVWRPGSIKSHQTHSWDLKYLFLVLLLSFHSWLLASRLVKSCIGIWLGFLCVKFYLYIILPVYLSISYLLNVLAKWHDFFGQTMQIFQMAMRCGASKKVAHFTLVCLRMSGTREAAWEEILQFLTQNYFRPGCSFSSSSLRLLPWPLPPRKVDLIIESTFR